MKLDSLAKFPHLEPDKMPASIPEPFAEDFSIVFLGNLNPAIFHPEWLLRHGLIGAEAGASAEVVVISPQVSEFTVGQTALHCDENMLQISTNQDTYSEQVLDLAIGVLTTLPHTPLRAGGINHEARYNLDSFEYWHAIGHSIVPKDPIWSSISENPGTLKVSVRSPVTGWDYALEENFTVEPFQQGQRQTPSLAVRANLHFPIPSDDSSSTALVERFLNDKWEAASKRALAVAASIFKNTRNLV